MDENNGNGFLLPPGARTTIGDDGEMEVEGDGPRKIPAWVEGQDAMRIWQCYRRWTAGERAPVLADAFGISVATVYVWVDKARAEVPHIIVSTTHDLLSRREGMVTNAIRILQEVADSPTIDPLLKVGLTKDLLGAANPYLTAQEEILGYRGKGSANGRVNVEQTGDNAQTVVFNFDTWLQQQ